MRRKRKMDPGGRLIIALLADKMSAKEKRASVKILLDDGLTRRDIRELFPRLLK